MSDPKKTDPDEELLEFLGGIDEVNEDSPGNDFTDYLANEDLDKPADSQKPPAKDGKRE
jgi:hypothetical protein